MDGSGEGERLPVLEVVCGVGLFDVEPLCPEELVCREEVSPEVLLDDSAVLWLGEELEDGAELLDDELELEDDDDEELLDELLLEDSDWDEVVVEV